MKVLLINPPMQVNRKPEVPPMGLSFIAQVLKKNGYEVDVLDIDGYRYSNDIVLDKIKGLVPDIIGIGGLVTVFPYLAWLVPEIRKMFPGIKVILGGAVSSSLGKKVFEKLDIDFSVIGEGEVTIVELLDELKGMNDFPKVKGIGYRDSDGAAILTEGRGLMKSLDEIPMLDDSLFPMETYFKNTGGVMQIHAQRGCPNRCTFCFNCFRVSGKEVRYRPPEKVVDEIAYFNNKYKGMIKLFAISGECITMNKAWLISFTDEILKRKLKIKYRVTSRVNTIDEERLVRLKASGCVMMSLGLESGSKKILSIMQKGATVEQGLRAVQLSKKYIKDIEASIMFGYAGEDKETIKETVLFAKEIGVMPSTFIATPFPGTELYNMAVSKGVIKDEDAYLMSLDKASIFGGRMVNMTDMPDDIAERMIHAAIKEIANYYYMRDPALLLSRALSSIKQNGLTHIIRKALKGVHG